MNIIDTIISGVVRSIKSIKGILTIWISTLILVSMVALPLKSSVKSVLGNSMITERIRDGIDVDVLTDFGSHLKAVAFSFTTGLMLAILSGILLNIFFNGGLFTTLKNDEEKYSTAQFFRGAGIHFWPFLLITLIMTLVILVSFSIVFGITMVAAGSGSSMSGMHTPIVIASIVSMLILPILLLVTDYARIWQVKASKSAAFKAIGIGFKQTFRHFISSYFVMFFMVFIQVTFSWFMLKFITAKGPQTGFGIFFLFLLTQLLFIVKLLLRVWRYGSVTAMYEKHHE